MGSILLLTAVLATVPAAQARVNLDAATIADFMDRVGGYVALQKKLDATLEEIKDDARPEQRVEHQRALTRLIQKERIGAKPGDIWLKPMRDIVRKVLASTLRGPDGQKIKHSILDEYTGSFRVQINGQYPDEVPLSSIPPQLLRELPKLPSPLEYRFVGRRLILLDSHARIIVDFADKVFP